MTHKKIKNLFLRQSYLDAWEDYEQSLHKDNFIRWDYVILTASNEAQADAYREQLSYRLERGLLPRSTVYAVLPDPEGKRVGSGGATFNVLRYIAQSCPGEENPFGGKRILVIHSGGDSKRIPQYSAVGKLFSPVPRELPNGYGSTLFDEFMIGMSGVPSRMEEGMLVLSGDVLLLFNPLQIDCQNQGAVAISFKEKVSVGKDHGVFLNDGSGYVDAFLHKQSEDRLQQLGAVNEQGNVDLDTGAVILGTGVLQALYKLISTDGKPDEEKYHQFVNKEARVSFYGDFLYPLANKATLEQYYREAAEGTINEQLLACRTKIWEALSGFRMRLLCLSPAAFIHFGTTKELCKLMSEEIGDFEFLDWNRHVLTNARGEYAANNAYIGRRATVEPGAYLENCYVLNDSFVEAGAVVSNVLLRHGRVSAGVVLHGLPLQGTEQVVRVYGVQDNPKSHYDQGAEFLGTTLQAFVQNNHLSVEDLWDDDQRYLWFAKLYPVAQTQEEALEYTALVQKMAKGAATEAEILRWKKAKRESLYSSFDRADVHGVCHFQQELEQRILANRFMDMLETDAYYEEALQIFGQRGISETVYDMLLQDAEAAPFGLKMRIYYALSRYMKKAGVKFHQKGYEALEAMCFGTLQKEVFADAIGHIPDLQNCAIRKDRVLVELPMRVNWGGGWTDTPPYCIEKGGIVLNAALKLNGKYPIRVELKKLDTYRVEFESADVGVFGTVNTVEQIRDCHNPYDPFALHKAALISSGLIPLEGEADLQEILQRIGGGIYLSTQVQGIPKGSGLGTSSILAGACIKGIQEFLGLQSTPNEICNVVLGMEQIMSTGGGWQDQVGGLLEGVKFITSQPGIHQALSVEKLCLSPETMGQLQERFALIYTGQRRLARNLLRKVVGNYIGNRPESVKALQDMRPLTQQMRLALEQGDIDAFAKLLDQHWALSLALDPAATNTCIDQIFLACEDLIDGKFICGAGGGGFLQVILKKGVTRQQLHQRLVSIFQDSGVGVWDTEFV